MDELTPPLTSCTTADESPSSSSSPSLALHQAISHIRHPCLQILITDDRGRGVFAAQAIPANTVIEESPVLVVEAQEYTENKLNQTIFESYLFTWNKPAGDYALALGYGSLFNHDANAPNVSYTLDKQQQLIRYTTKRNIAQGEELCIFYGHAVHFGSEGQLLVRPQETDPDADEEYLQALSGIGLDGDDLSASNEEGPKAGLENAVLALQDLPFRYVTSILKPEDIPVELVEVYVLNIAPQVSAIVLKFLREHKLEQLLELKHCKRIRRLLDNPDIAQIILCPATFFDCAELEGRISHALPGVGSLEVVSVPDAPARTAQQARDWSKAYWPVSIVPIKEDVTATARETSWTQQRLTWTRRCAEKIIELAQQASLDGELPIACMATESWSSDAHSPSNLPVELASATDARNSTCNPLAHCSSQLLAKVSHMDRTGTRPHIPTAPNNYLLTDLTVFSTHEPCLYCSMALLHSRIACLIYLKASTGAGGCGTVYNLHEQKGTNHHFEVWALRGGAWEDLSSRITELAVDP